MKGMEEIYRLIANEHGAHSFEVLLEEEIEVGDYETAKKYLVLAANRYIAHVKKNVQPKSKWRFEDGAILENGEWNMAKIEECPIFLKKKIIRQYVRAKLPFPKDLVPAGDRQFEDWLNSMGYMSYGWDAKLELTVRGTSANIAVYVKKSRKK